MFVLFQWAVFMGMEHERIHLETSSVLIRQLPLSMVTKPAGWVYGPISCGRPQMHCYFNLHQCTQNSLT